MTDFYQKLSTCQSLGFYNCCEMTTVFLESKNEKTPYNLFTIFVFDERAKQCYDILREAVEAKECIDMGDGVLKIGHLEEVPPIFVQQNSTVEISLNKVLKNNFRNGSYLIEFFDIEKV